MSRRTFAGGIALVLIALAAIVGVSPQANAISDNQSITVTTSSTNTEVTVSWTAIDRSKVPSDIGVGYTATAYRPGVALPAANCTQGGAAVMGTSCTLRGLEQGVTYDVIVQGCSLFGDQLHPGTVSSGFQTPYCHGALNTLGTGRVGYVTLCCQLPTPPQGVVAADLGGGAMSVTWTAPAFAGGASSLDYVVTTDPASSGCTTTALTCSVDGLPFGTPVTASVVSRNSAGASGAASSPAVSLVAPKPGQPYRVAGKVASTSRIAVTWKAPLDAAKLAVTSYKVVAKPGGRTCTARTTKCTIANLKRGVAYTFTVQAYRATTASGLSRPSSPVTIPLPPPPPAPTPTPAPAPAPAPAPTPKPTASFG